MTSLLGIASADYGALMRHLLPARPKAEEVAFVFASVEAVGPACRLTCRRWEPVPPSGFVSRGLYHLELTDEAKGGAIRKAHQLNAAMVELHSHPYPTPAFFSWSDVSGLREFAPHVIWRLKGRPYGAVVVSPGTYDSLLWTSGSSEPSGTLNFEVDGRVLRPTGLTLRSWKEGDSLESI